MGLNLTITKACTTLVILSVGNDLETPYEKDSSASHQNDSLQPQNDQVLRFGFGRPCWVAPTSKKGAGFCVSPRFAEDPRASRKSVVPYE